MSRRDGEERMPAAELGIIERLRGDRVLRIAQLMVYLKIALLVLVFDPRAFDAFGLPKSALSHLGALVLAALLLWLALRWGAAFFAWSPLMAPAGAVLAAHAAAAIFAVDTQVALFGAWRRYLGLTQILDFAVLFAAVALLFPTQRDRARLLTVCLATAVPVVLYALAQRAGLDPVTYRTGPTTRPIATLGNQDTAAGYFSIVATTAAAAAVFLWPRLRRPAALALAALAALAFGALLATEVRGGLLGIIGGSVALTAVAFWLPAVRRGAVVAGVVLAVLLAAAATLFTPLGPRLDPRAWASDDGVQSRLEIWETSFKLVAARPLLGLGPDNFVAGYPAARAERSVFINTPEVTQDSTHSWIFHVLVSAGLLGSLALAALLFASVRGAVVLARRGDLTALALVPAAAYLGQGLVDVNDIALDWVLWVGAGAIAAAAGRRRATARMARAGAPAALPRFVGAALLGAAALGVPAAMTRIAVSEDFNVSETLVQRNAPRDALPHARRLVELDPRRAEHWSAYGTVLERLRNDVAASTAFSEAARRAPWEPLFWRNLAITRLQARDPAGAAAAIERTLAADPFNVLGRAFAANLALTRGDFEAAVSHGQLAVRLNPVEPSNYRPAAAALVALKRFAEAERMILDGLGAAGESAELRVLLAHVYLAAGRSSDASREVDRALALQPGHDEATRLKAQLGR